MKIKNIKIGTLLISILVFLIYPIARAIKSPNHLLAFSDSTLIIGAIAIIIGVFNSAVLHGDYDIASYMAHKRKFVESDIDYQTYYAQRKEKRKDSFNYPLFIGIIFIILSIISGIIAG